MAKGKHKDERPPGLDPSKVGFSQKLMRFFIHFLGWVGIAILYYVAFSFFFDTPLEYRMKNSTSELARQYDELSARFDTVSMALDNVVERDKNVFRLLFESDPYEFESESSSDRWDSYEDMVSKSQKELAEDLNARVKRMERNYNELLTTYASLQQKVEEKGEAVNRIPAIQPVINPDLTLLTASFGLRIHPFFKSLSPHMGVDYTVPEGSRVFATADGRVKDVVERRSSSGLSVVIAHDNGYETTYSHLSRINVRRGQEVKRGDIIALSGNTGLSLAPHLHYEIKYNDMRIDPIHYFFLELSPSDYRRIQNIARSGMQSFD